MSLYSLSLPLALSHSLALSYFSVVAHMPAPTAFHAIKINDIVKIFKFISACPTCGICVCLYLVYRIFHLLLYKCIRMRSLFVFIWYHTDFECVYNGHCVLIRTSPNCSGNYFCVDEAGVNYHSAGIFTLFCQCLSAGSALTHTHTCVRRQTSHSNWGWAHLFTSHMCLGVAAVVRRRLSRRLSGRQQETKYESNSEWDLTLTWHDTL